MTRKPWTRKATALIVATLTLVCTFALLSASATRPEPFASPALNAQWQCTKTAGILTVCTKKPG
jgi:Spy/CpxP family protein refolding chaperone